MQLYPDDPRLGQKADTGQIVHWPSTDVLGRPYERTSATRRNVGKFQFVVIPAGGFNEAIEVIQPVRPVRVPKGKAVDDEPSSD